MDAKLHVYLPATCYLRVVAPSPALRKFIYTKRFFSFLSVSFLFCVSRRFATCRSAWRRCSAGTSWPTILTGPWRSASCATRSSPATTTSKCTWRTCTGKRRARGPRALPDLALRSISWPVGDTCCASVACVRAQRRVHALFYHHIFTVLSHYPSCLWLEFVLKQKWRYER